MKTLYLAILLSLCSSPILFSQSLYRIQVNEKWGYVDSAANAVIPPIYDYTTPFPANGAPALVLQDGKWGVMKTSGEWLVAPRFADWPDGPLSTDFSRDYVWGGFGASMLDSAGDLYIPIAGGDNGEQLTADAGYQSGRELIELDGNYGYLNTDGILVIPARFSRARNFKDGLAPVALWKPSFRKSKGQAKRNTPDIGLKWGAIDTSGKEVVPIMYDKIKVGETEDLLYVKQGSKWGACNLQGKMQIPVEYAGLFMVGDGFVVAVVQTKGKDERGSRLTEGYKWGVLSTEGEVILPFEYDYVANAKNGTFMVVKGEAWGVMNAQAKTVLPMTFMNITAMESGHFLTYSPDTLSSAESPLARVQVYDSKGSQLPTPVWNVSVPKPRVLDWIYFLYEQQLRRMVSLEPVSDDEGSEDEGGDVIRLNAYGSLLIIGTSSSYQKKYGYIRADGTFAIDPVFDSAYHFSEGVAFAGDSVQIAAIDTAGTILFLPDTLGVPVVQSVHAPSPYTFLEGRIPFNANEEGFGYYDKTGRRLFGAYGDAQGFSEGLAAVHDPQRTNKLLYGYVDSSGSDVIPHTFREPGFFREGLASAGAMVKDELLFGYIDRNGKWVVEPQFVGAQPFSNGRAAVLVEFDIELEESEDVSDVVEVPLERTRKLWGYIDRSGEFVVEPTFVNANSFEDGVAVVETLDGYQFIDVNGTDITPDAIKDLSWIGAFSEGLAPASCFEWPTSQTQGYINMKGEWVIAPQFMVAGPFNSGRACVEKMVVIEALLYADGEGGVLWKK